ncbi:hypothetical protein [Nonomuraea basaltis]|nr:hypothetical protein [Nonomuraea basaltis]
MLRGSGAPAGIRRPEVFIPDLGCRDRLHAALVERAWCRRNQPTA